MLIYIYIQVQTLITSLPHPRGFCFPTALEERLLWHGTSWECVPNIVCRCRDDDGWVGTVRSSISNRYPAWQMTWVISHVPIFHITQPLGISGLLDDYYFWWWPIAPKRAIYQSLDDGWLDQLDLNIQADPAGCLQGLAERAHFRLERYRKTYLSGAASTMPLPGSKDLGLSGNGLPHVLEMVDHNFPHFPNENLVRTAGSSPIFRQQGGTASIVLTHSMPGAPKDGVQCR